MRRASYGNNSSFGESSMCTVHICTSHGIVKANPADLAVKVRLAHVLKKEAPKASLKPVAKTQSKSIVRACGTYAPAPLQQGGHLVKPFVEDKDDYGDHYRMRCNASHERRKTRFLTERRREVVRY